MKKLLMKTVAAAILFSAAGSNIVQAEVNAKQAEEKSIWKATTAFLKVGAAVGTEIGSRAFNRSSWLFKSTFSGGSRLVSGGVKLKKSQAGAMQKIGRNYGKYLIGLTALTVTGGIAYYYISKKDKYDSLYNVIQHKCDSPKDESEAREIFEDDSAKQYIPKWYSPRSKARFIEGFVKYCRGKNDQVKNAASRYLEYLKKPWVTRKNLMSVAIGAAIGIALTFTPTVKESAVG